LIALLGSITDTLTITGKYAYANDFEDEAQTALFKDPVRTAL